MKIVKHIALMVTLCATTLANAQVSTFGLNYNISIPTGNSADFISDASFRGASFEYTYIPDDNFGIHFEGGWNNFYEKFDEATYERGTMSITGTQYRYTESVPLFVGLNYFLMPESFIKPYAALGLGTIYTEQRNDVGLYSFISNGWQFGLKPELGAAINLSENTFLKLSAKYYYGFKTDHLNAQTYIAFNMGLAFRVE